MVELCTRAVRCLMRRWIWIQITECAQVVQLASTVFACFAFRLMEGASRSDRSRSCWSPYSTSLVCLFVCWFVCSSLFAFTAWTLTLRPWASPAHPAPTSTWSCAHIHTSRSEPQPQGDRESRTAHTHTHTHTQAGRQTQRHQPRRNEQTTHKARSGLKVLLAEANDSAACRHCRCMRALIYASRVPHI